MRQPTITPEEEVATAQTVDQIVSSEIRIQGLDLPSGVIHDLYTASRQQEDRPLTYAAAQSLRQEVNEGDVVILTAGAGVHPRLPHGETDGPLGAAALARALSVMQGARPILLTEERNLSAYKKTARGAGLNVLSLSELQRRDSSIYPGISVEAYPEDQEAGEQEAARYMKEYDPSAVIGVEKIGPNHKEVYHTILGAEHIDRAKIAPLFDLANEEGKLTIGFGDGGNELGLGNIEDTVREIQPYGDECQCPCGGGNATRVTANHAVIGGTSNWAAYGVEAMLAILNELPDEMHTPDQEKRMLEWHVMEGGSDGVVSQPLPMVDGTSLETQTALVQMLNTVVENRFTVASRET